jgi:hypothetical protein
MKQRPASTASALLPVVVALRRPAPWLVVRFGGPAVSPPIVSILTALAILGAAFLLSWSAELLQMDTSQALALAVFRTSSGVFRGQALHLATQDPGQLELTALSPVVGGIRAD